jgi:hypothetical protein
VSWWTCAYTTARPPLLAIGLPARATRLSVCSTLLVVSTLFHFNTCERGSAAVCVTCGVIWAHVTHRYPTLSELAGLQLPTGAAASLKALPAKHSQSQSERIYSMLWCILWLNCIRERLICLCNAVFRGCWLRPGRDLASASAAGNGAAGQECDTLTIPTLLAGRCGRIDSFVVPYGPFQSPVQAPGFIFQLLTESQFVF